MQSPSSLIFLVLLGVWAAYFVQYWVRRRDHVATARSVEQFSEAMRVLERRDPLPSTDLSEPAPASYAVHPSRAARPQVLVKRAVASDPAPIGVTARIDDGPDAGAPVAASAGRPSSRPSHSSSPTGPQRRPAAVGAGGRRVRPSRRVRGLLLLAALAELLLIVPLVAFSVLPLWTLAPAFLAVGAALFFLRSGVRAERALVRAARRRSADLARRRAAAPVTPTAAGVRRSPAPAASTRPAVARSAPAARADVAVETVPEVGSSAVATPAEPPAAGTDAPLAEPLVAQVAPAPTEAAYDVMVPIVDDDDIPLTWDPVPVPRPTYTMKAKAERPGVAPAAVTPDHAPVVREGAESDYDERRVAGA